MTDSGHELFIISMDVYDNSLVEGLWTNNKLIEDEYKIRVGQTIENALEKRPTLKFYSDLHYNVYAFDDNSRIRYRLIGDFKSFSDTSLVARDYSVERWQIAGMKIESLIWKK